MTKPEPKASEPADDELSDAEIPPFSAAYATPPPSGLPDADSD